MENKDVKLKIQRIHFGYIIFILVITMIVLVTVNWGGIEGLIDYFSFALTVSSIILALLAIIYAFFSSRDIGNSLTRIQDASREITDSSSELETATKELEEIPEVLEKILQKSDTAIEKVQEIQDLHFSGEKTDISDTKLSEESIQSFMQNSPSTGKEIIFICKLSHETGQSFTMQNICDLTKMDFPHYMLGWIMCMRSFAILEYDIEISGKGENKDIYHFTMTKIDNIIIENIENVIDEYITKVEQNDAGKASDLRNKKRKIRGFFAI